MTRSRKILRQLGKLLGDPDAESRIAELCSKLQDGADPKLADYIKILASFPAFLDAVDASYAEYDDRVKVATRNLELSSTELNGTNRRLEHMNSGIHAMLDNLGQGMLFFDLRGVCGPTFSAACRNLLECEPAGKSISEVLKLSPADNAVIFELLQMLESGGAVLDFEDLMALAPSTYAHSQGLYITLSYKPLPGHDGKIAAIMLVATDKTPERRAAQKLKEKESEALRILRISRSRHFFFRFMRQFQDVFGISGGWQNAPFDQLFREIHTLKGTAATFHLAPLTRTLHELETAVESRRQDTWRIVNLYRQKLFAEFQAAMDQARDVLGDNFEQSGSAQMVPMSRLQNFAGELALWAKNSADPELRKLHEKYLRDIVAIPIHSALSDFCAAIEELADATAKQADPVRKEGENFSLLLDPYAPLFASFIHIARNIMDHGIETPEMRIQFGKPAAARISVITHCFEREGASWFSLEFCDDGQGVDIEKLRRKIAGNLGSALILQKEDHEFIQHIFGGNLSTAESVSALSGRAVGMSAVKGELDKLGGRAELFTEAGKGSRLRIEAPLIWTMLAAEAAIDKRLDDKRLGDKRLGAPEEN